MSCFAAASGKAVTVFSGSAGLIPSDRGGTASNTVGETLLPLEVRRPFLLANKTSEFRRSMSPASSESSHTSHLNLQDIILPKPMPLFS